MAIGFVGGGGGGLLRVHDQERVGTGRSGRRVTCALLMGGREREWVEEGRKKVMVGVAGVAAAAMLGLGSPGGWSVEAIPAPKFPPIDRANPKRCEVSSSAMGQANAARDALFDLRECVLSGKDLAGFDIAGAIMQDGDFSGTNFTEAVLSKAYAVGANFKGANFTNAVVDRAIFNKADLTGAIFANTVLSESIFSGANLENVDFTDAYIGDFAQKTICKNPTLKGENPVTGAPTRASLGCP